MHGVSQGMHKGFGMGRILRWTCRFRSFLKISSSCKYTVVIPGPCSMPSERGELEVQLGVARSGVL